MSTSSLPSFIKIYQAVLEKKLKMWKFTDNDDDRRRRTDGRRTVRFIYNYGRKKNILIYAYHIYYKNIRNFCRLFEPDYYTKLDKKKNVSKVPNNLLKSNCEFEGLGKFKMIFIVNMFKIL